MYFPGLSVGFGASRNAIPATAKRFRSLSSSFVARVCRLKICRGSLPVGVQVPSPASSFFQIDTACIDSIFYPYFRLRLPEAGFERPGTKTHFQELPKKQLGFFTEHVR